MKISHGPLAIESFAWTALMPICAPQTTTKPLKLIGKPSFRRLRLPYFAPAAQPKNPGKEERKALATINSEGGNSGLMVRSQLRK
jgi:hypothetical protein